MEILIDFLGRFTFGLIMGSIIAITFIKIYKQFKKK
jgi:hypothetical protein